MALFFSGAVFPIIDLSSSAAAFSSSIDWAKLYGWLPLDMILNSSSMGRAGPYHRLRLAMRSRSLGRSRAESAIPSRLCAMF